MNSFDFGYKNPRLKELVNVRLSQDMMKALKSEKEKRGLDLSGTIRCIIKENIIEKRGDKNEMSKDCIRR